MRWQNLSGAFRATPVAPEKLLARFVHYSPACTVTGIFHGCGKLRRKTKQQKPNSRKK
jgi:hypothetical protein